MGAGHPVVNLKKGWRQALDITSFAYVCELSAAERVKGWGRQAAIDFDVTTQTELRALVFEAADGRLEFIGDYEFTPEELAAR